MKVRLPTVDSRNIGTTRRLELAERSARRPCRRRADLLLGGVVQGTVALCRAEPCIRQYGDLVLDVLIAASKKRRY